MKFDVYSTECTLLKFNILAQKWKSKNSFCIVGNYRLKYCVNILMTGNLLKKISPEKMNENIQM